MIVNDKSCATCKHFFNEGVQFPECHLNPPQTTTFLLALDKITGQASYHKAFGFPITMPQLWCGQYARKIAVN